MSVLRTEQVETLVAFDQAAAVGSLTGCHVQSLDLSGRSATLAAVEVNRAVFLGCVFAPGVEAAIEARGALVFPQLPDLPFNPYRSGLYTAAELYAGLAEGYRHTLDARAYRWWRHVGQARNLTDELAMTLHDHAIIEALAEVKLTGAVGVMGGHQIARGHHEYREAALLGRALAATGRTVLTGGGPGAMEAVNLGASLVGSLADLDAAMALLGEHSGFAEDIASWVAAGLTVTGRWELSGQSYGIPTWLYGHEPPNVFCAGVAKLFSNAIREDVLLRHATGGLICLPGAAGTVQEIFQAVTPRYYADDDTPVAPLILVGIHEWTQLRPAWPLLAGLADGRPRLKSAIHLVATAAEAVDLLAD
jgi:predicted Rossmann-fold nucleotide-binding protein